MAYPLHPQNLFVLRAFLRSGAILAGGQESLSQFFASLLRQLPRLTGFWQPSLGELIFPSVLTEDSGRLEAQLLHMGDKAPVAGVQIAGLFSLVEIEDGLLFLSGAPHPIALRSLSYLPSMGLPFVFPVFIKFPS
jgi:hypothetical protein